MTLSGLVQSALTGSSMFESSILFRSCSFHLLILLRAYTAYEISRRRFKVNNANQEDDVSFCQKLSKDHAHQAKPMHPHKLAVNNRLLGHLAICQPFLCGWDIRIHADPL